MAKKKRKIDTGGLASGQLLFSFSDIESEFQFATQAFDSLIDPSTRHIFRSVGDSLKLIRSSGSQQAQPWGTDIWIRTKPSIGEYQADKKGSQILVGEIRFKWRICPYRKNNKAKFDFFHLAGNASISINILTLGAKGKSNNESRGDSTGTLLSSWNFDIGAPDSPGCFFHAQTPEGLVKSADKVALDIPRIPTFIYTPIDAVDYLLGELFQERWRLQTTQHAGQFGHLRKTQADRLTRTFDWLSRQSSTCSSGSPLCHVKRQKPDADLLIR